MMQERSKVEESIITKQFFLLKKHCQMSLKTVKISMVCFFTVLMLYYIAGDWYLNTLSSPGYTKLKINGSFENRKLNIGGLEYKSR